MSAAPANTAINVAVAGAFDDIAGELESAMGAGMTLSAAAGALLSRYFREHRPAVFNGNNYGAEWRAEAARRGLPDIADTPAAVAYYKDPATRAAFRRHAVLSDREMDARHDILLATYTRTVEIEASLAAKIGRNRILPACLGYRRFLAGAVADERAAAPELAADLVSGHGKVAGLCGAFSAALDRLDAAGQAVAGVSGPDRQAAAARDRLLPAMVECRRLSDELERLVDNERWPLPKYHELLWAF